MGRIQAAYLVPHPPIILKEVGKGEEKKIQKTIDGMKEVAQEIKEKKPGTIIIITPHGPLFRDAVAISVTPEMEGDMGKFGAKTVRFIKENHLELTNKILQFAKARDIFCAQINKDFAWEYNISSDLDHGVMVPLYFIDQEYIHYKLVHITYGLLPREDLYKFGKAIQEAVEGIEEDVIVIASGDLSHKLSVEAPAGYHPSGKLFDTEILKLLEVGAVEEILSMESCFTEEAGECALRSIDIMLGTCDGFNITPKVLSYEGPFGVGYGVVRITIGDINRDRQYMEQLYHNRDKKIRQTRKHEDPHVKLARSALEYYVEHQRVMNLPQDLPQEMLQEKAGVFVSLKKHGELRGCIGTIEPTTGHIADEIIRNAIQAGANDPRFYPVEEEELKEIIYSVDVLKAPERINTLDELDVKKYGVIVSSGRKSGLLLPNLENVDTVEEQVRIALQKAGIQANEGYNLQRFEVERHK
ncbi:AmmeMemoRadiSam system protein A/AmmeMemoRadiSam system protein B [Anaerosolibacter carboniphilus]|uniref:AmmeMemoRadiSam system protein A/AmmeMemoRadiSam system protein B n=1 Tax=Anaerosolibacter carboniphilus TaxID=1417629 RepID=A0A841KU12_9FIRM|nr:AmmeMemoRadiSam system protein A [Anaerosolibacter carboniphilus]MBB6216863.1 AmmeMemoRadiSam system protein A/AmmeMemoRadiSam system protein B [Anaerosolibacter carboniphilus]